MRTRADLHDYQRAMVEFIKSRPGCALWADMGTGKSVTTLTALADLFDTFDAGRALVIAPLRVARDTWPREPETWAHLAGLRIHVIQGPPARRVGQLVQSRADVFVINRELVPWLVETFLGGSRRDTGAPVKIPPHPDVVARFGGRWPFDVIVIDEASGFKDHASKGFKALRRVAPGCRVIELTGTPAGNGLLGLWSQIYLIDRGQRLGRTITAYRTKYFEADYMGYNYTPRPGTQDAIYAALADVVMRVDADDHLDLPPYVFHPIRVALPAKARAHYRELEREFLTQIEADTVEVPTAAALTNKLLQCANGAVYVDEEHNVAALHSAKLDALADLVDEYAGRPMLVAYGFRSDLARLLERFPRAVVLDKDPATIARWNRGEIGMLITHPASAGHGLNLQFGGNVVVWFGLTWSLELHLQFNARLRRQGQRASRVLVHPIVAADTVDETVLASLDAKNTNQRALLDALRRDIRGRL